MEEENKDFFIRYNSFLHYTYVFKTQYDIIRKTNMFLYYLYGLIHLVLLLPHIE